LEEGGSPLVAGGLQTAQTADAVVLQVGPILPHQSALFGHQKEKEAVDQTQQLAVKRQGAFLFRPFPQGMAARMTQKAVG